MATHARRSRIVLEIGCNTGCRRLPIADRRELLGAEKRGIQQLHDGHSGVIGSRRAASRRARLPTAAERPSLQAFCCGSSAPANRPARPDHERALAARSCRLRGRQRRQAGCRATRPPARPAALTRRSSVRSREGGTEGDVLHALLCAVGHNLRLLRSYWCALLLWLVFSGLGSENRAAGGSRIALAA